MICRSLMPFARRYDVIVRLFIIIYLNFSPYLSSYYLRFVACLCLICPTTTGQGASEDERVIAELSQDSGSLRSRQGGRMAQVVVLSVTATDDVPTFSPHVCRRTLRRVGLTTIPLQGFHSANSASPPEGAD